MNTNNNKLLFWQECLFLLTLTARLTADTFDWADAADYSNSAWQSCYGIHIMTQITNTELIINGVMV